MTAGNDGVPFYLATGVRKMALASKKISGGGEDLMSAAHFHRDIKKALARFKGRTVRLSFFPDCGTTWVAEILPEHRDVPDLALKAGVIHAVAQGNEVPLAKYTETLAECGDWPIARGTGMTQAEAIDNLQPVEWTPRGR